MLKVSEENNRYQEKNQALQKQWLSDLYSCNKKTTRYLNISESWQQWKKSYEEAWKEQDHATTIRLNLVINIVIILLINNKYIKEQSAAWLKK